MAKTYRAYTSPANFFKVKFPNHQTLEQIQKAMEKQQVVEVQALQSNRLNESETALIHMGEIVKIVQEDGEQS